MRKGHWSFLHEWVIYDYLTARSDEGTLRLKNIISGGKVVGRTKWTKVESVQPIFGTTFPDIKAVLLKGHAEQRPAEVKFRTSLFTYHSDPKYYNQFAKFTKQKGFILVVSHDHIPPNLIDKYAALDVFEIELEDFVTFCRENFARLLNRQINSFNSTRVWLMYQGPNFNEGKGSIKAGRESCIWCPTENLTGFDLTYGDRVLFFKTNGIATQDLQKKYQTENSISEKWMLQEIYIAEVRSKIHSRNEFLQIRKKVAGTSLWKNDPQIKTQWRWNRVFEFEKIRVISKTISMRNLHKNPACSNFVSKSLEAFCYGKSREISLQEYRNLLETII